MSPRNLVLVGLDFRTARVDVRERWTLDDNALKRLHRAAARDGIPELVVLRTCNRTELVAWTQDPDADRSRLIHHWSESVGYDGPSAGAMSVLTGAEAARHLFRVTAGMESQILGDIHILGQVKKCYREAIELGTVGPNLHRLFSTALRGGKRVRSETELMAGHRSVGSEAARFLVDNLPASGPRRITVVGVGKVGSHAARYLAQLDDVEVVIINRTTERARMLAREWGGRWGGMSDLPEALMGTGGLLVATGADEPWVTEEVLAQRARQGPLPIIDVSLPRNVSADVRFLPGVSLWDLDHIHPEAARVEEARREAIPQAEEILETELDAFCGWVSDALAREALRPLQEWLVEVCRREVGYVSGEGGTADRAAKRIAAKVLARPMVALRSAGYGKVPVDHLGGREGLSEALLHLFSDDSSLETR